MFRAVFQNSSLDKTKSQIQAKLPKNRMLGVEESFKLHKAQQVIALGCHMIQQHLLLPWAGTYCVSGRESASPGLQHST